MKKTDVINQIIEVGRKLNVLRKREEELMNLRERVRGDLIEIEQQILMLEIEESSLEEQYRKEHTREFYQPLDEIDICRIILSDGFIKGFKF